MLGADRTLDGLDEIHWDQLNHAYGPATDVPALLRELIDADVQSPGDSNHPLWHLYGNIYHQGTVYPATPHAVPFLIKLAANPNVRPRADIVGLVGAIAQSEPEGESHAAVAAGIDVYVRMLQESDRRLRLAAAHTLSAFPEHEERLSLLLRKAFEVESDSLSQAGMLLCLGQIGSSRAETTELLSHALADTMVHPVRAAAAASLAILLHENSPPATEHLLIDAAEKNWFYECFSELPWDVEREMQLTDLIMCLGARATSTAIHMLNASLSSAPPARIARIFDVMLILCLPPNRRPSDPLTEDQVLVLRSLVNSNLAWKSKGYFLGYLLSCHLPEFRWQLASLVDEGSKFAKPNLDEAGERLPPTAVHRGQRVFQPAMGWGTVTEIRQRPTYKTVTIDFEVEGFASFDLQRVVLYRER
jgi:hypothetical protein